MELTQARLKELLHYDPDTGVFTRRVNAGSRARTGDVIGNPAGAGYLSVLIDYRRYFLHRLAWLYVKGAWPAHDIDHLNRCKTDNRFSNLRPVTRSENQHNVGLRRDNTSGYIGVKRSGSAGKWAARITIGGEEKYLGSFATLELASDAYQTAKRIHHPTAPL